MSEEDEIYLDLRVRVNAVSLFSDPKKVLDLVESKDCVKLHENFWGDQKAKISIHGVNICCAELADSSYSAIAEVANLRAVEDAEERISSLNSYLDELKKK